MKAGIERIQDCEEAVENGLVVLEKMSPSNSEVARALQFLTPKGFRPVVEFRESGRKKRRTASAANWAPATGEILITFDPLEAGDALASDQPVKAVNPNRDLDEVCEALAEAEIGRSFVALKWFRDEFLPAKGYSWATTTEDRHAVLTKAITGGR